MKKNIIINALAITGLITLTFSCVKEPASNQGGDPLPNPPSSASFVEEFDNVGNLVDKGWIFLNNSTPIGNSGWRQGRYEANTMSQYKFLGPVPFVGYPAKSANQSPNDFVSADATVVGGDGHINAWLISPVVPIKNGDQLVFWTRAVDDSYYPVYTKDRMQVRANFASGTVSIADTGVGNFSNLLLDINPNYIYNDASGNSPTIPGYPRQWTKYTVTFSDIPGGSTNAARFGFRYVGKDAGLQGGSGGNNYPTVVGIDSLAFIRN